MQVAARTPRTIGISLLSRDCEKSSSIVFVAVTLSLLYAPSVWATETTWDVLENFGLRGTWAISCGQPATSKSFHTIFVKGTGGLAMREIDFGAGFPIRL